jgi:hypothetical protein
LILQPEEEEEDEPDSCTTSSLFPACSTKYVVVTSLFPDQSSQTVSTSTSTTYTTVAACTGTATIITTTSATATTVEQLCDKTNCGGSCAGGDEREVTWPTDNASAEYRSSSREIDFWVNQAGNPLDVPGPEMANIPTDGSGDWMNFYSKFIDNSPTDTLDNTIESLGSQTSVLMFPWRTESKNVLVKDLYECTAIIGVSHKGQL